MSGPIDGDAAHDGRAAAATQRTAHRETDHESRELLREAATMALYVSVVEIAELAVIPEKHFSHGLVTGAVGGQLLEIIWGTAVGLALAHWFAFRIAAHGFHEDRPTRHDLWVGLAQLGAAAFVAAVSSLPVLLFSDVRAQEITADVPATIIGVLAYLIARGAHKGRVESALFGVTALLLGVLVALIKTKLAAH